MNPNYPFDEDNTAFTMIPPNKYTSTNNDSHARMEIIKQSFPLQHFISKEDTHTTRKK